ncbi:glycosyl hydrolase 53 family protein [Halalkalibacter sp. APA_J-10(15)]|uniref:glycosyl hydrolase 53 family protein n=1 Tax=Halalkalibacter sp. APA_J-10(15) TaxID=2933805 RepID=UPI001FF47EEA|nr:glycosyl hydrolase 53 family protein [Halalkalibacter sp. APA_J-10(15)]MCK0473689.1 glycosyl hydrolase 53 family protein [Halalkalibacter sp. APA_J-10(15)]
MKNHSFAMKVTVLLMAVLLVGASFFSMPTAAYYGHADISPAYTNLTTKSWVTADAGTGDASLAVDQNYSTYWDADSVSEDSWLVVDLGGTYPGMKKVEVVFPTLSGEYNYKLEASSDGEEWFTISDRSNEAVSGGEDVLIQDIPDVRYLKATLLDVSDGAVAGIAEIRANNYFLKENLTIGADLSWDTAFSDRTYTTHDNTDVPSSDGRMIGTMQETGMTSARFRVWNEPRSENTGNPVTHVDGSMNPEDTLNKSIYANDLGMMVGVDFHYSDSWADPSKQIKPKSWKDLSFDELVEAVYDFTYEVTADHVAAGVTPYYIQVGNEIIDGTLWGNEKNPTGNEPRYAREDPSYTAQPGGELLWEYWGSEDPEEQEAYDAAWDRFTRIIDAGLRASQDASPESKTKIHVIVGSTSLAKTQEFWRQLTTRLKEDYHNGFDIMSISYYPEWHGPMENLSRNLHAFATEFPEYELAVSETSHRASGGPSDSGYPNTIQGQADFLIDVMRAANDTINNSVSTVLVWEPAIWQSMFTHIGNDWYQANDSTRIFHAAFSDYIPKTNEYLVTDLYTSPALAETMDVLNLETNTIDSITVDWDTVPEEAYSTIGSFTVNGTTEHGEVTAHVAVVMSADALEHVTNEKIDAGEVSGPLVAQLTNSLKQVKHHYERGSTEQAVKFLENYLFHLERKANERNITEESKADLSYHVNLLLDAWK